MTSTTTNVFPLLSSKEELSFALNPNEVIAKEGSTKWFIFIQVLLPHSTTFHSSEIAHTGLVLQSLGQNDIADDVNDTVKKDEVDERKCETSRS